jgi:type IV pilus biogenesis protein CpaD/CtpE
MRHVAAGLTVAAALAFAACKGDQGPVAGELSVRLATPRSSDRAIMMVLTGAQHGVTAATGSAYRVFSLASTAGDTTWVTVVAPKGSGLVAGEVARITVPDTRQAGSYKARVGDVAAADYSVSDTAGVSLTVVKP